MDKTFRAVVLVYTLIGFALIAFVIISLRSQQRSLRSAEWIDHTRATLSELDSLLASLQHAEGAVRTYLFTDAETDQTAYRSAFNDLGEKVELARAFVTSDPSQLTVFEELENRLVARADLARALLAEKQSGNIENLKQRLLEDDADNEIFEIRRLAQQIRNHFTQQLSEHDRGVYEQDRLTGNLLMGVATLTIVTLMASAWFIRDDLKNRRQLAQAAEQTRVELESLVQTRTKDLETANLKLKTDSLEMRWRSEALDHQLRYSQRIIDAVSDLVFVVTKLGRISRINPAVTRLTGFDSAEVVNRPLIDLVVVVSEPKGAASNEDELISQAMRIGDGLRDVSVEIKTKTQINLAAKLRLSPLHDHDQKIGAVVTLQVDKLEG